MLKNFSQIKLCIIYDRFSIKTNVGLIRYSKMMIQSGHDIFYNFTLKTDRIEGRNQNIPILYA